MCFAVSFSPATIWAVIGFFVLLGASKADGGLKIFGQVLGVRACAPAVFIPLGGRYASISELCQIDRMLQQITTTPAP